MFGLPPVYNMHSQISTAQLLSGKIWSLVTDTAKLTTHKAHPSFDTEILVQKVRFSWVITVRLEFRDHSDPKFRLPGDGLTHGTTQFLKS